MHILGLHVEGESLKVALVHLEKKEIKIDLLRSFSLKEIQDVNPLYILAPILAGKKVKLVSGLDSWEILIRKLSLNLASPRAIYAALPFQLEALLPYSLEEAILLPFLNKKDKQTTEITLFATTISSLKDHLQSLINLQINPDSVSCTPAALHRFARFVAADPSCLLICHLAMNKSIYVYVAEGNLMMAHTLNIGYKDFQSALKKDTPEHSQALSLDLFDLSIDIFPNLHSLSLQFQRELNRLLFSIKKKISPQENGKFLLSGEIEAFGFHDFLKKILSPSLMEAQLSEPNFSSLQPFAVPIGLALDALLEDRKSLQFRQGSYVHPEYPKKKLKNILSYLICCTLLCLSTAFLSSMIVKKRKAVLYDRLQSYLAKEKADEVVLKGEDLEENIANWEKTLSKHKQTLPLELSVPKVADVLAWVSSHPQLLSSKEKGIEIKYLHYTLVKYPKVDASKEPYQAKVELEFAAASPRLAREFHDILLKGDPMVDTKNEVSWSANQNSYHTSFFLNPINRR